ncbi:MAG: adenosylmethionine--8-amino-7-oxononanoate transaminase [Planctomycetaceae bacterium]|nr:adenosylmethionine--8-amino-7-oxononanoate transaminase [Planctomycetaceae bacterium]
MFQKRNMNFAQKDLEYIWHPCSQMKDYEQFPPIVIERGGGIYLYDIEGKKYADVVSSWWCNLLGHNNPRINRAVKEQLDMFEHVIFANFTHKKAIELCERLAKVLPAGLKKFFFTDNGSSAIEAAMKMSFQYHQQSGNPQKKRFMSLTDAYHGETIGALSTGDMDLYTKIYKPVLLEVIRLQTGNIEQAEKIFVQYGDETCALLVEPVLQMAAGMKIYRAEYLKKLRELCNQYNVHLIADEIATGYGRTGEMFACFHAGVTPDMMCLSKGLTGGYMPMAITVTTQKIYDAFYADYNEGKAFLHSHTYCGNPLACAAAVAVLEIFEEENILQNAQNNAGYFAELIREKFYGHKNVGEIRSIGLVNAIELTGVDPKARVGYKIYREAIKNGLLLRPLGDLLYFNPPLNITRNEMKSVVDIAGDAFVTTIGNV